MWWLIQNIIFSICLIVIIHYLYIYFETTLTSPKVKDFIHSPKQEYKVLLESIHKKAVETPSIVPLFPTTSTGKGTGTEEVDGTGTKIEALAINYNSEDMKSDLKDYMHELKKNSSISTNYQLS
jgi:hypothetical protein